MLRLALIVAIVSFVHHAAAPTAYGQAFFQMGQQSAAGRLIEPPRGLLQQLRDAERAASQKRYAEAVVTLGDILQRQPAVDDDDELSGQDFFLDAGQPGVSRPTPARVTIIGEARRMLSEMPVAAMETYELRYGPDARELLKSSQGRLDWGAVAEVRRRFFHTEAGRDATALLAQRAISQGRPIEAIRLLDALRTHPRLTAEAADSIDLVRLAMRRAASGGDFTGAVVIPNSEPDDDGLFAANEPPKSVTKPRGPIEIGGQMVTPPAIGDGGVGDGGEFDQWLAQRFAEARPRQVTASGNALMTGGDVARSESSEGQLPLSIPRWMVRTAAKPSQERFLEEVAETMVSAGEVAPPAWSPLKVGDQVLMRSTERLYGLDFRTGKLIWQYPWFESSASVAVPDEMAVMMAEESGQTLLKQRVWNDLPYGRITSDGKRAFLLTDLAAVEVATFNPLMGFQGTRPAESGSNTLVALDLATEGKLAWKIGGPGDQADGWGKIFFLGPPLPVDDALYVMAEISGDIVLICLDAATGLQRWRQHLLSVEGGDVNSDPIRRVSGGIASYHEGLLVCSTGAGGIVAVDLLDQSLAWALLVERNEVMNQNVLGRRDGFSPEQLLKRWWDGSPRIVGDTVYVTPIETDRLYAIDLLTGEKRWKELARSQNNSRYLAGVKGQAMLLVGNDHVRGVDSRTSNRIWETPPGWLEAGEQVSGVGVFGDYADSETGRITPAYFLPTTSNRIVAIAVADGAPLAYRSTQFPTGNLVAVGGQILSQSPTALSVAHGQQTLEPLVAATLANNPDDFQAVVRQAELLLQKGELAESLRWLDRARGLDPDDVDVENLSVRAMLSALRKDFAANVGLLPKLERLIYWPNDRVELIKLQVRAELEARNAAGAVERLIELSQLIAREPSLGALGKWSGDDPARQVSLDGWLSARVAEALSHVGLDDLQPIDAAVGKHLDSFTAASTPLVKRLLVHFGGLKSARPLTMTLLDRHREDGSLLAMERLVLGASAATPATVDRLAPWQKEALAEIYGLGGLMLDAASIVRRIGSEEDAKKVLGAMKLSADEVASVLAANDPTPWGKYVSVRIPQEMARIRGGMVNKPAIGKTRRVVGETFRGWQVVSDASSPFGIRDPLGTVFPIPLDGMNRRDDMTRQVVFSGGLMIAMMPGELVGVNLFEVLRGQVDSVIWNRPWRTDASGGGIKPRSESTKFGDQVYRYQINKPGGESSGAELVLGPIVGETFYVLQGTELIACDALTGEPRWRNLETPRGGGIVCDGNVVGIVSPVSNVIALYDCRDGRKVSEKPLNDYQLWASTDDSVLLYRDTQDGGRELVLLDPIADKERLRHTFADVSTTNRVFGRVVNGGHVVTLSTDGQILIWDLAAGRVVSDLKIDPIPGLKGLQVIGRNDSMVLLPNTADSAEDRSGVAVQTNSGQEHVRVDFAVINISLADGKIAWNHSLGSEQWGCTLTQSPVSPLLVLARGKSRYLTTGSRTKTIDLKAIDVRNGKPIETLDHPVESFSNDIETTLMVQPSQQRVGVTVGNLRLEYEFSDTERPQQLPADKAPGGTQPPGIDLDADFEELDDF